MFVLVSCAFGVGEKAAPCRTVIPRAATKLVRTRNSRLLRRWGSAVDGCNLESKADPPGRICIEGTFTFLLRPEG